MYTKKSDIIDAQSKRPSTYEIIYTNFNIPGPHAGILLEG